MMDTMAETGNKIDPLQLNCEAENCVEVSTDSQKSDTSHSETIVIDIIHIDPSDDIIPGGVSQINLEERDPLKSDTSDSSDDCKTIFYNIGEKIRIRNISSDVDIVSFSPVKTKNICSIAINHQREIIHHSSLENNHNVDEFEIFQSKLGADDIVSSPHQELTDEEEFPEVYEIEPPDPPQLKRKPISGENDEIDGHEGVIPHKKICANHNSGISDIPTELLSSKKSIDHNNGTGIDSLCSKKKKKTSSDYPVVEERLTRGKARAANQIIQNLNQADEITSLASSIVKIPVVKNGNSTTLSSVKIDEETAFVSNTCAFDSLLQILLTASYDYEPILVQVDSLAEKTDVFKVIQYIMKKGVNSYMYNMRAQILKKHFEMQDNPEAENEKLLDCLCNIGSMTKKLFECVPSFTEISKCQFGCPPRIKKFTVYPIEVSNLMAPQGKYVIDDFVNICQHTMCTRKGCSGIEETILNIGNIVMLDIPINTHKRKVQIKKLATELDIPKNDIQCLKLLGFVDMDVKQKHYTAVVYRDVEQKWSRFDDIIGKVQYIPDDTPVRPALLVFIKVDR
ncbi:uncharacterized protein LOC106651425 isoform X1 [Trichogramma pretiosum]|uniref:uncharacterized protein LOC106651425 isoform X1 n=1 Tax=Trichogramma pretiosum TaxID=7493 RepID=UPI0006C9E564|nr:uncharacterized protein LOC106651425 isoform X1 [Trichogramma pretiosum]